MRKLLFITSILLLAILAACSNDSGNDKTDDATQTEESENKDLTINFGVTPWTSTVPPIQVARLILEDMGYTVEETEADVSSIYVGLSREDIHVYMDS